MKKKAETETKTLVLLGSNGKEIRRVTVPKNAKVTYGGLIPGAKSFDGDVKNLALRIYMGQEQLAVFVGVFGFRTIGDVTVLEKKTKEAFRNVSVNEGGVEKMKQVRVETAEWINPDVVEESTDQTKTEDEFLKLKEQCDQIF